MVVEKPDETPTETVEENTKVEEPIAPGQNNTLIDSGVINGQKIDWNGNVIPDEPWYDKTLFTIDDFEVSTGLFAGASAATIVIIASIIFAICSYLAYRKRKLLAGQIRRVSGYVSRVSMKIRQSISG